MASQPVDEDGGVIPPSPSPSTTLLRQYITAMKSGVEAENRDELREKIRALKYCIVTTHQEYCIVTSLTHYKDCWVLVHRSASRLQQNAIKKSYVTHVLSQAQSKEIRLVVFEQYFPDHSYVQCFYKDD